jgi:hypothetical protein
MGIGFHVIFTPFNYSATTIIRLQNLTWQTVFVAEMHGIFSDFFFELKPING